jgi:putative ABC transport system permease protein
MKYLFEDARLTLRLMRRQPGMALLVVAALALGIGLNTAIFSVMDAVILRPLPVADPDRLVSLFGKLNRTGTTMGISYPEYMDLKAQSRSFADIAPIYGLSFSMTGQGQPEHLKALSISASGFRTWGVTTILGRGFTEDEDRPGAPRAAVLNYEFWRRRFGGDPAILGRTLALDEQPYTVIGVLQPTKLKALTYPDVWVANGPLLDEKMMLREARFFFPMARLRPGVSQAQARTELDGIAARLAIQYPKSNKDMGIVLSNETEMLTRDGRKPLPLLIAASGLILALVAVNVMTVFMSNMVERGRELSVRLALGAGRWSLLRQLLVQSVIFALIGASIGLALAKLVLTFFLYRFPDAFFRFQETTIDFRVVLATAAASLLTALAGVALPALYALRLNPTAELRGEWSSLARPRFRAVGRSALILFEVSLASALTLVSGLLIKSFYQVEKVDLGFSPSHVLSFQVNLPTPRYKDSERRTAFYKAAAEKLAALPGTQASGAISNLPLTYQANANNLEVDAQSPLFGQKTLIEEESALPGFFQAMQVPLLQGRDFNHADREGAPFVAIVAEPLAAKLWPGQNPIGKRVLLPDEDNKPVWREVIGVVRAIKHLGPERKTPWMQLYVPMYQNPLPSAGFVVNTTLPQSSVRSAVEKAIHEVDGDLPLDEFKTMDAYLDSFLSGRKVTVLVLSVLAGIGVIVGAIGVYGVVAGAVIQRRREIAIRMAIGATISNAILLVTRLGLFATLGGIAIGSILVMSLTRVLAALLFGVSALDPAIYAVSAVILVALAGVAGIVPAIRLMRFNIQEILRQ